MIEYLDYFLRFFLNLLILQQLGLATALGALIGLERERKHQIEKSDGNFGGIRTFALIGLAGALSFILSSYSIIISAIIAAALFVLVIASYVMIGRKYSDFGITSEVSSIIVFIIGILSGMQLYMEATVVALVVLAFLLFKNPLHEWAGRIKFQELISTLEFMIIAFVILPILPNQAFGPYDFFNPYLIWLLVVFISGISFVSYLAIKIFGPKRGLLMTGFLAGFISTTALSFSLSNQSKKNGKIVNPYLLAITVASAAMFVRMLLEVLVLNHDLFFYALLPMCAMALSGVIIILFLLWKGDGSEKIMNKHISSMKSPFSLLPALKFGALFAFLIFVLKFGVAHVGNNGIFVVSTIFGFFDVDAVTVSMSNLAKSEISNHAAVMAMTIAAIMNTLLKVGIFYMFADRKLAKKVFLVLGIISLVGILSLFFN